MRTQTTALSLSLMAIVALLPVPLQATFLYGSNGSNCSGGYVGPNPSIQNIGYWAMHMSLPPPQQCTNCGPMTGDPNHGNAVTIVPVLWRTSTGGSCTTKLPTVTQAQVDNFYAIMSANPPPSYISWIQNQYGVPRISALPTVIVNDGSAPNALCSNVTPTDIERQLTWAITTGGLKTVVTNNNLNLTHTIFAVHFASNVTINDGGACAFNMTSAAEINNVQFHYLALGDYFANPCNWWHIPVGNNLGVTTFYESHELIENLTDPGYAGSTSGNGWTNHTQSYCPCTGCQPTASTGSNQMADGCQQLNEIVIGPSGTTPVNVQGIWSNAGNRCMVNSPGAAGDTSNPANDFGASGIMLARGQAPAGTIIFATSNGTRYAGGIFTQQTSTFDASFFTSLEFVPPEFLSGDFDGDGGLDMALTGVSGWSSIPVAFSRHLNWHVVNQTGAITSPVPGNLSPNIWTGSNTQFMAWSTQTHDPAVSGDFNGDGLSDIALIGDNSLSWNSIPLAFSSGDGLGDFWVTNGTDGGLGPVLRGSSKNARVVAGDFNGDGLADIAAFGLFSGTNPQSFIAVALSQGDGTFKTVQQVTNVDPTGSTTTNFNAWAADPATLIVVGDFNGDGLSDIALQNAAAGWQSIPVAFANGGNLGSGGAAGHTLVNFAITNQGGGSNQWFAQVAGQNPGVQLISGDYDGDGVSDLGLTGISWWQTVPIAFSTNNRFTTTSSLGTFSAVNSSASTFGPSAGQAGTVAMSASQAR